MPKKFQDLSKRLLVSSGIVLLLAIGFVGYNYLLVQMLTVLFIGLMTSTAMTEYVFLVKHKGEPPSKSFLGSLGFIWVVLFYIYPSWFWLIIFFLGYFLVNFLKIEGAIYRIATGSFAIIYILVPIGMILSILYPSGYGSVGSVMQVVYLLSVTKIADVGGYFIGKLFGKTKLAPVISPSKTVVGAVFGLVCSVGVSLLFCETLQMSWLTAFFLGLSIGIAAELGDLAESVLKRDANVKDSNKIPGLGGVLDLIDSLLFTTPILFAYLRF